MNCFIRKKKLSIWHFGAETVGYPLLVWLGAAWHYKKYSDNKKLADAEKYARNKRLGLWKDDKPIPPWE